MFELADQQTPPGHLPPDQEDRRLAALGLTIDDLQSHATDRQLDIAWSRVGPLTATAIVGTDMYLHYQPPPGAHARPALGMVIHHGPGEGCLVQADQINQLTPRGAVLVDLLMPYTYVWEGAGRAGIVSLELGYASLRRADLVGAMAPRALDSSMGQLLVNHVDFVLKESETLGRDEFARSLVVRTTSDLLRAFITTAATADGEAAGDAEFRRVVTYARRHLSDPDLSPASIAAAHFISERQLYRLCERAGIGLSEWILHRRLEAARADLADPVRRDRSIEQVAHDWGFRSAAHFSRRFKESFDMTPTDWRRLHAVGASRGGALRIVRPRPGHVQGSRDVGGGRQDDGGQGQVGWA